MRIRVLEAAQREVDDAVAWYDESEEKLGLEFLAAQSAAPQRSAMFIETMLLRGPHPSGVLCSSLALSEQKDLGT